MTSENRFENKVKLLYFLDAELCKFLKYFIYLLKISFDDVKQKYGNDTLLALTKNSINIIQK